MAGTIQHNRMIPEVVPNIKWRARSKRSIFFLELERF